MWYELYVREKVRELEEERARRRPPGWAVRKQVRPHGSAVLRGAGRSLRRLGEGLEAWGAARSKGASDGEAAW